MAPRFLIGVCSNFSHAPTALQVLEEAGLLDSIHAVVISETNGSGGAGAAGLGRELTLG